MNNFTFIRIGEEQITQALKSGWQITRYDLSHNYGFKSYILHKDDLGHQIEGHVKFIYDHQMLYVPINLPKLINSY